MNTEEYFEIGENEARRISEAFEQDSRRYDRALTEEQEARQ